MRHDIAIQNNAFSDSFRGKGDRVQAKKGITEHCCGVIILDRVYMNVLAENPLSTILKIAACQNFVSNTTYAALVKVD